MKTLQEFMGSHAHELTERKSDFDYITDYATALAGKYGYEPEPSEYSLPHNLDTTIEGLVAYVKQEYGAAAVTAVKNAYNKADKIKPSPQDKLSGRGHTKRDVRKDGKLNQKAIRRLKGNIKNNFATKR